MNGVENSSLVLIDTSLWINNTPNAICNRSTKRLNVPVIQTSTLHAILVFHTEKDSYILTESRSSIDRKYTAIGTSDCVSVFDKTFTEALSDSICSALEVNAKTAYEYPVLQPIRNGTIAPHVCVDVAPRCQMTAVKHFHCRDAELEKIQATLNLLQTRKAPQLRSEFHFYPSEIVLLFASTPLIADQGALLALRNIVLVKLAIPCIEATECTLFDSDCINEKRVDKHRVNELIAQDNAIELLKEVSRFGTLVEHIIDNTPSIELINNLERLLKENSENVLLMGDVKFVIRLLPYLMETNAIQCFELFIKTYYFILTAINNDDYSCEAVNLSALKTVVYNRKNNYFIDKFIELTRIHSNNKEFKEEVTTDMIAATTDSLSKLKINHKIKFERL